ncbi:MAG: hypothetical protein HYX93_05175 [Chloroflexi bacterium]|nr:hypothetical protein [Chloroflexota bacterium]
MKSTTRMHELLKVLYRIHCSDPVVRQYGIYPWELTDKVPHAFADAGDALAAIERMRSLGWIKVLIPSRARQVGPSDQIHITEEGIREAERLLGPWPLRYARGIFVAVIEGIVRAYKKE